MIYLHNYEKSMLKPGDILVVDSVKDQYLIDGFKDAVITTTVKSYVFTEPKFVLRWDPVPSNIEWENQKIKLSMRNLSQHSKFKKLCKIYIHLTPETIAYLIHQTQTEKHYSFGNVKEQREVAGSFYFTMKKENDKYLYDLHVDKESVRVGNKESASFVNSFGTFHTHPLEAYQNNDVCIAWPSADDYLAFLHMYGVCCTGFHIVSTLEGIYLITLKKYIPPEDVFTKYFKKKKKDYIEDIHGADYPVLKKNCQIGKINMSLIRKYVERINKKGYFNLVFKTWKECQKPFCMMYAPVENTCLLSTKHAKFKKSLNK